jgi:MoxR-like ATPase
MSMPTDLEQSVAAFGNDFAALKREVGKRIVGQEEAVRATLIALLAGGHVLIEGLPGTGKTLLARTIAAALDVTFHRVQCTPDLVPTDLIGTYVIMETPQGRRTFEFQRGPLFANVVLADQINRTTPKTQSAMLEAMDETSITVSTESFPLPRPFLIVATQNPLEMEGTYPLPEAQIDRFMFKVATRLPTGDEMLQIVERTTGAEELSLEKAIDCRRLLEMGELVRRVSVSDGVRRLAVELTVATQPDHPKAPASVRKFVRYGSSPRGAQAIVLGAKATALLAGRTQVSPDDCRAVAGMALRHRLAWNVDGLAENVSADAVIDEILAVCSSRSA